MSKMPWQIPGFSKEEGDRRHALVRLEMEPEGLDCLVVAGHMGNYGDRAGNLRYMTNYAPWFDDEYLLFPLRGTPLLMTWSDGHADWARRISWIPEVEAIRKSRYVARTAEYIRDSGWSGARIGICDLETIPAYVYEGLRVALPNVELIDSGRLLSRVRMVKSDVEVQFVEKSAECADIGFWTMLEKAKPGVPERSVWAACEEAMTVAGAQAPSFTLIVSCKNVQEKGISIPNVGSSRVLEAGDLILNEISPSYGGYWVQLCAPIVLGTPSDSFRGLFDLHKDLYELALSEIRPGATVAGIEEKAGQLARSRGCDRGIAHLQHIGLVVTDRIPDDTVMQPNMTFVVHPMTWFGARGTEDTTYGGVIVGNTVVVTGNGCRVLSKIPIQMHQARP